MAQYSPKTWTTGETITAAELNALETAAAAAAVKADADAAYDAAGAASSVNATAASRLAATLVPQRTSLPSSSGVEYAANSWHYMASSGTSSTDTLTNGVMRLLPWTVDRPITVRGLAVEVATAGEANAVIRFGIYAPSLSGALPGALVADLGSAAANAVGYTQVAANLTLQAGTYWLAATVQNAPTTQPTVRVVSGWHPSVPIATGTTLPATGQSVLGYSYGYTSAATGAVLPQTIPAVGQGSTTSGKNPRFLVLTGPKPVLPVAGLAWTAQAAAGDFYPTSLGSDGLVYGFSYAGLTKPILRASNGGRTIESGWNFSGQVAGEVPVWAGKTTDGYVVVMSSDNTQAGAHGSIWFSATFAGPFTKVKTIRSTTDFAIAMPQVGTNGKSLLLVGEYGLEKPTPARQLWMSTDGGQTWSSILTCPVTDTQTNAHVHHALYDPATARIWASTGDGPNASFQYSDNLGGAWTTVPITAGSPLLDGVSTYQQPVLLAKLPGGIFGTPDRGPTTSGLWKIDATTGQPSVAFTLPSQEITYNAFGRGGFALSGNIAYIAFPDSGAGTKRTYIVGTGDGGASWVHISTIDWGTGNGARGIVGPDAQGYLYHRVINGSTPETSSLLTTPSPAWT